MLYGNSGTLKFAHFADIYWAHSLLMHCCVYYVEGNFQAHYSYLSYSKSAFLFFLHKRKDVTSRDSYCPIGCQSGHVLGFVVLGSSVN